MAMPAQLQVLRTTQVVERRETDTNIQTDGAPGAVTGGAQVKTHTLTVDASGKATFTITADDPDPTDRNNPDGDSGADPVVPNRIDRVRVTFAVTLPAELTDPGPALNADLSSTAADGTQTITFSDAASVVSNATVEGRADYLMAPSNGSASNVVTVTVVDQYGQAHAEPDGEAEFDPCSSWRRPPPTRRPSRLPAGLTPLAQLASGTPVWAGLQWRLSSHTTPMTPATLGADNRIPANTTEGGQASVYWVSALTAATLDAGAALVADAEANTLIIANTATARSWSVTTTTTSSL